MSAEGSSALAGGLGSQSIMPSPIGPGSTVPLTPPTWSSEPVPSTEPAATDIEAVTPVLQALVDRYDAAVAAVLADPRVVNDPESSLVAEYVALFTADNPFPLEVIEIWHGEAEEGRSYRPGPGGVLRDSTVMSVAAVSADEVEFVVCIANSVVIENAAGEVVESRGGVDAGELRAAREHGVWLLRDLSLAPPELCPEPEPVG